MCARGCTGTLQLPRAGKVEATDQGVVTTPSTRRANQKRVSASRTVSEMFTPWYECVCVCVRVLVKVGLFPDGTRAGKSPLKHCVSCFNTRPGTGRTGARMDRTWKDTRNEVFHAHSSSSQSSANKGAAVFSASLVAADMRELLLRLRAHGKRAG